VYYPIAACGEAEVSSRWEELEGYVIEDESSDWTGIITGIDASTVNVLFRVDHLGRELLIPASDSLIVLIDENRKRVIMKIPEGLWDL
jgi:16S rRNA processing protein RimM